MGIANRCLSSHAGCDRHGGAVSLQTYIVVLEHDSVRRPASQDEQRARRGRLVLGGGGRVAGGVVEVLADVLAHLRSEAGGSARRPGRAGWC